MSKTIHTSWEHDFIHKENGSLIGSVETDVAIIGGGIAGILAAYEVSETGKKVVLIEKARIGSGATLATTAFLTQIIDTDYSDIIKCQDITMAKDIALSHKKAIDRIEEIIKKERIECEWQRISNYIYASTDKDAKKLERETKALNDAGIHSTFLKDKDLGFEHSGTIEVANQAKFNPGKFISALVEILRSRGVEIYEHSPATSIETKEAIKTITLTSNGVPATIKALWIIVTTYEPFMRPLRLYFKKAFYTSYVYELEFPKGAITEGTFEDTANPYHYFRIGRQDDRDRVIVGGEDHRSDLHVSEIKCFKALMKYIKKTFKNIPFAIIHQWKGPILESVDGLAFIGEFRDEHMLYAMAFSGNGMTYAMISAQIFKDAISGTKNDYAELYRANRLPYMRLLMQKGWDYAHEFFGGAVKNSLGQNKTVKKIKGILE